MRTRSSTRRGGALGSTLLIAVLLFIFGLTLANLATFDLRVVNRTVERQAALEAAEAGLNHLIARLSKDPTLGAEGEVYEGPDVPAKDGGTFRISFAPGDQHRSLNNLSSLKTTPAGLGRTVPANHMLIFAEGRSRAGEKALVECLVRLEAMPYAVAATNRLTTSPLGGLTVAGRQGRVGDNDLVGSTYSGSSASNSTSIGPVGTLITGDVHSVGGASVLAAQVAGDIVTDHDIVALPNLNIENFSTLDTPGRQLVTGGLTLAGVYSGPVYIDAPPGVPTVFAGLIMNDAVIYVNGDLNVLVLLGSGAVFVNGSTTFLGAITLNQPSDRITLFSKGDILVNAAGLFQGVLMTQGNFRSSLALIVSGAVYANGQGVAGAGNVAFNGLLSTVDHVDEYTAFASYWLALGSGADVVTVYWNQIQ